MPQLQSKGLVRRILSLGVVFGTLILGFKPSEGSQPAPRPAAAKKNPSFPPQLSRREFTNFQGRRDLSLAKDEVHVYLFDLQPDDFVDIKVEQKGLDVTAKIDAPGKLPTVEVDRLNGDSGPEAIPLLAEVAGCYRVELTGSGSGNYQILVPPKRKATPTDRRNAAGALAYSQGLVELKAKQKKEAEKAFRKALESWVASGYLAGQADTNYQLEKLLHDRDARREALPFLEKASVLYHGLGNPQQEAIVLNDLGMAHSDLEGMDQALPFYERALELARKIKDSKLEASILYNRGKMYTTSSEFKKALTDLDTALEIRRRLQDDPLAEARTLLALCDVYSELGQADVTLRLSRQSLEILKHHRDPHLEGLTFMSLGGAYQNKGNNKLAISHSQRAFALLQNTGYFHDEATALNNLATAYFAVGRYQEALNAFQHCQRIFEAHELNSASAVAWINVGWVLATLKRYRDASEAYGRSLTMVHDKNRPMLEVEANYGLAWTEWQRGNPIIARGFIEKSLASMEVLRNKADRAELRSSFLARRQGLYDLKVEILMAQHQREPVKGYDLEAFEASERARSRTLLDVLEGRPVLPALSVRDIQRQVLGSGDVVLLEYFLGAQRSYLWVVTSSSFTRYVLPASRAQVEALAREVRGLLDTSNKRETRSLAIHKSIDLSRLLFGQVAGRLKGKKLLIVAPPALQYIPFGALPEDKGDSRWQGSSWPRSLSIDHEITVELSATVLATLRRLHESRPLPSKSIAILADPVFSVTDVRVDGKAAPGRAAETPPFPRLQYSQSEAEAIAAQAWGGRPLQVLGFDANRKQVLSGILKDYRYLHFSAHGVLDEENPGRSAVVLSLVDREGKPIDGYLRAEEIAKLELPADLVVLSACKTGLGREIRGEGLVGLTQAFFTAGASRVMVSLWDVDDQATATLMGRFYQNLQKHLTPTAALKEAQIWMWQQPRWNAPSYWAGFVLRGEWK